MISAIVGLDTRATMDLDTTLRRLSLTEEQVRAAITEIAAIDPDDDIMFHINTISPIRKDDVYILSFRGNYDRVLFREALRATAEHRGSWNTIENYNPILDELRGSEDLRRQWEKYRREFYYAREITFEETIVAVNADPGVCKKPRKKSKNNPREVSIYLEKCIIHSKGCYF